MSFSLVLSFKSQTQPLCSQVDHDQDPDRDQDHEKSPGYRLFELQDDGLLKSRVFRLDNKE